MMRPRPCVLRRDAGLYGYERALARRGLAPVAGVDEAGRGACAGPLVVAAVTLPGGRRGQVPGLADSKALAPAVREQVYAEVVERATAWSVVVISPEDIDRTGLHPCNVRGMRRALARLPVTPRYVFTDGFPVGGVSVPTLAIWKGDQVAACVAAASVVAKVTRDRIMVELGARYPEYDFAAHKGYVTPGHAEALASRGPCPQHRRSYVNVARALDRAGEAVPYEAVPCAAPGGDEFTVDGNTVDIQVEEMLPEEVPQHHPGPVVESGDLDEAPVGAGTGPDQGPDSDPGTDRDGSREEAAYLELVPSSPAGGGCCRPAG